MIRNAVFCVCVVVNVVLL